MSKYDVLTEIAYFSSDEKFEAEKPYTTAFPIDDRPGANSTNHEFEPHSVVVHDVRLHGPFDLNGAGFQFMRHSTSLTREDFDSNDTVENRYYSEINELVQQEFPQYSATAFLEYEVRKRSELFPHTPGAAASHAQPLTLPHIDYTAEHARRRLEKALRGEHPELLGRPFQVLNIWRLLKGPNNDWPLALCDYRTVDPVRDPVKNDILFREEAGENMLLRHNDSHRWYYMSDQDVEDVIVFRNAQTDSDDSPRAWHASFFNPRGDLAQQTHRESIEVRVAAFT